MKKVVIADDELKICRLIETLIDWYSLNMEIIDITHNGIDTLRVIAEKSPDLVITDIRMPGYDGLEMIKRAKEIDSHVEFIVISGYRHFEYAQSAIKYGVVDYLLKPIKKDELSAALKRINNGYEQKNQDRNLIGIKNHISKGRKEFLWETLSSPNKSRVFNNLEEINNNYGYKFNHGLFQILAIKLDDIGELYNTNIEFMTKKIHQIVQELLKDSCYDLEIYFESTRAIILLNYSQDNKKLVRRYIKELLDKLLLQESILEGLKVTLALGGLVHRLEEINMSYKQAVRGIDQRIILGTKRIIEGDSIQKSNYRGTDYYIQLYKNINHSIVSLNLRELVHGLEELKIRILRENNITGHEILNIVKGIFSSYLIHMRANKLIEDKDEELLSSFSINVKGIYSVEELFDYLINDISKALKAILEEKKQEENKPILQAKIYMESNFKNPITLEEVASKVGFNATYFSTLFKKYTGTSFIEYLSEIRINNAKNLLRETSYSITAICEEVGYSDIKHFTKCFVKYTGLKPKEFRKLYS